MAVISTKYNHKKPEKHEVQFSYSVVIPTHNEIRDLEVTVAMAWASEPRPHEIIVIDDCGEDDVKERLSSFPDVKVIRTDKRLGAGAAKRFGANLATGDVIVIMDSHMRMPYNWLEIADEAIDNFPEAIFCCGCQNFSGTWTGFGARFISGQHEKHSQLFAKHTWLDQNTKTSVDKCPCLLGGCYFIPRFIWEIIGGLNPCLHGWGYEEPDLSLRAWLTGFEVRRMNNLTVSHRFQRELKEPKQGFPGTYADFNAMAVCASIFEDGVFERLYYPYFKQVAPLGAVIEFEDNLDEVNTFREFVQSKRMYHDTDLDALCGFRLPTSRTQGLIVEELQTKSSQANKENRRKNRNCRNCNKASTKDKVGELS
jgi:glycosyltransferase involved in cell wall biosynthesis